MIDEEKEERRKKKEERRRTKSIFLRSDFATPTSVSKTLRVVLHLNSEGLLVPRLRTWLGECFREAVPIHDVQDAILNIACFDVFASYMPASA